MHLKSPEAAGCLRHRLGCGSANEKYSSVEEILQPNNEIETFIVYVAEHWPSHFRAAQGTADNVEVAKLMPFYHIANGLRRLWFPIYWQTTNRYTDPQNVDELQLAALLGHNESVAQILRQKNTVEIDKCDDKDNTALI
jgi:hypothetical protein